MVRRLPDFREAVPNECVTVRCEAFVLCRLRLEEKFVCGCPLLGREIERRQTVRERNDDAASRKHVGRVAGIARRGVQTEGVLEAHVGRTELGQIAEDAVIFGHACIFMTRTRPRARGTFRTLAQPSATTWLSGWDSSMSLGLRSRHSTAASTERRSTTRAASTCSLPAVAELVRRAGPEARYLTRMAGRAVAVDGAAS